MSLDLQPIYDERDPETKTRIVTNHLRTLLDHHAPERSITVRDKRIPWLTRDIERAIELRDLAFALYSRNPNRVRGDQHWLEYTRIRNQVNSLIHQAKSRYAERNFSPDLPSKKLWCNLRREGIHNSPKKNEINDQVDPNTLNQFFAEGHLSLQNPVDINLPIQIDVTAPRADHLVFRHTNVDDVCRKMYEIDSSAIGDDGLPISFLKMLCPFVLPLLTNLFNSLIDTKTFPNQWKKAIVTPIPKTSNPTAPKDFRPISVLPAMSKIFEKVLLDQIVVHVENANPSLLSLWQSGYRKKHSTTTALAKITHDIYCNLDANRCTVMVLIDFSLAFNCVKHQVLRSKLNREFGFSPGACDLIGSFLHQRVQVVKLGQTFSPARNLVDGTPQGSCLSALLFSLYINNISSHIKCQHHLYADDLQIYASGPISEIDNLIAAINEDLGTIENWSRTNFLTPNPKKTQAIVFSKEGSVVLTRNIVFCGEPIALLRMVKNLGLLMDANLKWDRQVNDVVSKAYNCLRTFRRFHAVLPTITRRKLVQAVVVPLLTYCDVVYYPGLSSSLREQLHRCFKSAIRFIFDIRRRDTTAHLRGTIMGRDLPEHYLFRISCFMRNGFYGNLPPYLLAHLPHGRNERAKCFLTEHHTNSERKSVLVFGASHWNHLPLAIKAKSTLNSFKKALSES